VSPSRLEYISVIVAQKLKKKVKEVPLSKSIKDLVGGKSTLQNKVLGDLQQELTSAPKRERNCSLRSLALLLGLALVVLWESTVTALFPC
jgi:fatty acid synthase subunit alpha